MSHVSRAVLTYHRSSLIRSARRALNALQVTASAALLLRLFGVWADKLPSSGWLAVGVLLLHVADLALRRRSICRVGAFIARRRFPLALAAIMLLALVVRLPGFASDIGQTPVDIDENRLALNVRHFFVTGELSHGTVEHYPGVVFWMFAAASFVAYVRGLAAGVSLPPDLLPGATFVFACRFMNIFVAAGIVGLTGLLGRRLSGAATGLLAAATVAIVPLSVDTTVLVRNDPGMVMFVTAAVYASLVAFDTRRTRWLIAAGVLAGIATAVKYSSMFAVVPALLAAVAHGYARDRVKQGALVMAGFVVAIAITNHFIWMDFPNFLRQLSDQVAITGRGHYAASDNPASVYVAILTRFGPGLPLLILAGGFTVYGLVTRRVRFWILFAFPLLYVWFMTLRPSQFPRWVYPLVPFVAIAGATALTATLGWLYACSRTRSGAAARYGLQTVAAVTCALCLGPPIQAGVVALSRRVAQPTHAAAIEWISTTVPPGSSMLLEQYWLNLEGVAVTATRVPDLAATLSNGIDALRPYEWVVVPEIHFGHPTLRRLRFVRRFHADQGFGGSRGHDYEIYTVPRLPEAPSPNP